MNLFGSLSPCTFAAGGGKGCDRKRGRGVVAPLPSLERSNLVVAEELLRELYQLLLIEGEILVEPLLHPLRGHRCASIPSPRVRETGEVNTDLRPEWMHTSSSSGVISLNMAPSCCVETAGARVRFSTLRLRGLGLCFPVPQYRANASIPFYYPHTFSVVGGGTCIGFRPYAPRSPARRPNDAHLLHMHIISNTHIQQCGLWSNVGEKMKCIFQNA